MRDRIMDFALLIAIAVAAFSLTRVSEPVAAALAAAAFTMLFAALLVHAWSGPGRDDEQYLV